MVDPSTRQPWAHCPRSSLQRALARLKQHGLDLQVGFELEFVLFKPSSGSGSGGGSIAGWEPVDNAPYASSSAMDALAEGKRCSHLPAEPSSWCGD
jgi:glutamine synthetase